MKPIEILICAIIIWIAVTTSINRSINPEKTGAELLLDTPNSIRLDFNNEQSGENKPR